MYNSNIAFQEEKIVAHISDEIISKAKTFDDDSLKIIYDEFKPFIRSLALKYFLAGSDKEDIIQEGMIGLFHAIESYDKTRGADFIVFSKNCIVLRIKTAIKNSLRKKHSPLNEYQPIEDENGNTLPIFCFGPEEQYIDNENFENFLLNLKNELSSFEYSVLCLINSGMTYKEIASAMGKEPKAVDNAIQRIKTKVKKMLYENK